MLHFRSPDFETRLPRLFARPDEDTDAQHFTGMGFAPSGFTGASVIATDRGDVLARDLRAGDLLVTRDHGLQPLRWIGANTVIYYDEMNVLGPVPRHGPIRIRAGSHGTNPDAGNLVLAPGQRLLVHNPLNELLFGQAEVMAAVGDLTHLDGIDPLDRATGRWVHLLLDAHELIRVNGIWLESLAPDMWSISTGYPELEEEIVAALPRLSFDSYEASYVAARLSLEAREACLLDAI